MRRKEVEKKFDEIVEFSEIARFIDTPTKHYSSGMRVRLAFSVAAHLEPEVMFVDEVLAVGDAGFRKKCLEKVRSIAHGGSTVIVVSHNAQQVTSICERAIWLSSGQLVDDGPDNVFFVGHPKSGNTWMALMLAVLKNAANTELVNTANVGQHIPVIHARDLAIAEHSNFSSPRIFRNEGPLFLDNYPKTLFIVRDPRSALVSYFHHCKHDRQNEDWKMEDFIKEMLEFGCIRSLEPFLIRWDRQVLDWHNRGQRQSVHFVRYEDLKTDCLTELCKVAEFVGLKVGEPLLKAAVDRGSFTEMRKQEVEHGAEAFAGEKGSRGFFIRTGQVDSWRDELSPASIQQIEQTFAPAMELMGYTRAT